MEKISRVFSLYFMRIDNLHFHSEPKCRTTSFSFLFWRFRECLCYEKEDGVPWDSMVGVRVIANWCEFEDSRNLFRRGSLRLSRWETLARTGTTLIPTMKISQRDGIQRFSWWVGLWWNGAVIVVLLGNRIECELAGVRKWFLTPALKLQRCKTKACTGALI